MGALESFSSDGLNLVREVVPARGRPYRHACTVDVYVEVLHAIDRLERFSGEDLVESTGLPFTQVFTALAFLKERGVVVAAPRRKHHRASSDAYLDGMIEWHALDGTFGDASL